MIPLPQGMGYLGHFSEGKTRQPLQSDWRVAQHFHGPCTKPSTLDAVIPTESSQTRWCALQQNRISFIRARAAGRITAAAPTNWISELYNRSPYNPIDDREWTMPHFPFSTANTHKRMGSVVSPISLTRLTTAGRLAVTTCRPPLWRAPRATCFHPP